MVPNGDPLDQWPRGGETSSGSPFTELIPQLFGSRIRHLEHLYQTWKAKYQFYNSKHGLSCHRP